MKIEQGTISKIKSIVDPEMVLHYLGFHIVRKTPKELRGPCKVHGGDNPTSFRMNVETKTWSCYSRHCEADGFRDIIGLVQRVLQLSFVECIQLLADMSGVDLKDQDQFSAQYVKLKQEQDIAKEIRQHEKQVGVSGFYPEETIQEFKNNRTDYFIKRGFPGELLDFFEVGSMIDPRGVSRETIPIRDPEGNLLTVSGRRTDSDKDPKYWLTKNISKGTTLYNLDVAKNFVGGPPNGLRTLILVEGFVDVWTLALYGVWNVVAAMGTDLTQRQGELFSQYADLVLLMLDPDDAGQKGMDRVEKMLSFYTDVERIDLPKDKDPKYFTYSDVKHYFGGYINV